MRPHADPVASISTVQSAGERSLNFLTLAALLALALGARLPAYRVNENWLGDAIPRTDMAQQWADAPHWISSFSDGARQFGPLHLYVVGAALKLGASKQKAGPLTSLVFGTLTVLPLAALSRRLFGREAAVWSAVALSFWGLHIQMSTTGASEALSLFLLLAALALYDAGRMRALAASGLTLTLACAVRYDTWLLVPLLSLVALLHGKDRRAAFGRAVVFGACCLPFPLAWLYGNWRAMGDPLYPIHFVESFHREWQPEGIRLWGEAVFRIQNLGFWPGVAVMTLGPLAAGAGIGGMIQAFRARRDVRWVLWTAWVPAAYFTFRGAVLLDFQPLARFTVGQVVLLLPFLKPGADVILRGLSPRAARAAVALGMASMVAVTVGLAWYTDGAVPRQQPAHSLLPLSPLSRNPPEVRGMVALFDAQGLEGWEMVLVDADPGDYRDIQVAFGLRHPGTRVVRRRWEAWEQSLGGAAPDVVIRFEGGPLETTPGVSVEGRALHFRGRSYGEVPGAPPPMRLYRARP
jgi:hypothetical protein